MNKEFLRSDRKPNYMKGIRNTKDKNRDINTVHSQFGHNTGDNITYNDGTTYTVRWDGAWIRTSKKRGE